MLVSFYPALLPLHRQCRPRILLCPNIVAIAVPVDPKSIHFQRPVLNCRPIARLEIRRGISENNNIAARPRISPTSSSPKRIISTTTPGIPKHSLPNPLTAPHPSLSTPRIISPSRPAPWPLGNPDRRSAPEASPRPASALAPQRPSASAAAPPAAPACPTPAEAEALVSRRLPTGFQRTPPPPESSARPQRRCPWGRSPCALGSRPLDSGTAISS
jgi:hypothetical protein